MTVSLLWATLPSCLTHMSWGLGNGLRGDSWLRGVAYGVWNIRVPPWWDGDRLATTRETHPFFPFLPPLSVLLSSSLSPEPQKGPFAWPLALSPHSLVGSCQSHWAPPAGAVSGVALVTQGLTALRELGLVLVCGVFCQLWSVCLNLWADSCPRARSPPHAEPLLSTRDAGAQGRMNGFLPCAPRMCVPTVQTGAGALMLREF